MNRKSIRAGMGLFALAAVPAALLVALLPASAAQAASTIRVCEANGDYCIGSQNLNLDTNVSERRPGRQLVEQDQGNGNVKLAFSGNVSECVAAANNDVNVRIHRCNGGSGTVWHAVFVSANDFILINQSDGLVLSGRNNGSDFTLQRQGQPGYFQKLTTA